MEEEGELNYYATFFQKYDAQIGRFTGVDMYAEKFPMFNPYQFGGNNPVSANDPSGALARVFETVTGINQLRAYNKLSAIEQLGGDWRDYGTDSWNSWDDGMAIYHDGRGNYDGGPVSSGPGNSGDNSSDVDFSFSGDAAVQFFGFIQNVYNHPNQSGESSFSINSFKVLSPVDGSQIGTVFAIINLDIIDPKQQQEQNFEDRLGGVDLLLGYSANDGKGPQAQDLNWRQVATTNQPQAGQKDGVPFVDQMDEAKGTPYYYLQSFLTSYISLTNRNQPDGQASMTTYFHDAPDRYAYRESPEKKIYWNGVLSLVDIRTGTNLITFSYGFTMTGGIVHPTTLQQIPNP